MTVKSLLVQIGADTKELEKKLGKANTYIQKHADQFKKVGRVATVAGATIVGALGLSIKSAISFNREMANISTLIPGQTKRVSELKKVVQDLAMVYGTSTADIAQGLYQVISAFGDTADTAKILEINVKGAAAGMATTTEAIDLTSAVTKAYGDTSAEAVQKVMDLAFQTVKLGQTTFPELAGSIGKVTPLAKALNLSQEELFGTFATLTGVTGDAAKVSTQFSGVLGAMITPTEGMDEAMASLGKEIGLGENATAKATIAELGFKGTLAGLKSQTDGTTVGLGKLFASKEALVGLLPILSTQSEVYNKKLREMANSVGITDEAFIEMSEGINKSGFDMKKLREMVSVLSQRLGDQLAPMIGSVAVAAGKVVQKITTWIKKHPVLTGAILKLVAGMGVLATVLGPILIMLPALATGFTVLWGAIMGPVGLVVAAIGLVAGAAYLIVKKWEPIKDFFANLWKSVTGLFVGAFNSIKKKILVWAEGIVSVLEKIPLAKKLAGPWRESLERMRADMDETVGNVNSGATAITSETAKIGKAWLAAIKGSKSFKTVTGLLKKGLGFLKIELKGVGKESGKVGQQSEEAAKKIAAANKKIIGMTKTMTDEIKKATLSEYEYSKEMLEQKLEDQLASIEESEANEKIKNTAIAAAREAFRLEDEALDIANKAKEAARQEELTAKITTMWGDFYAAVKAKQEEYKLASEDVTDRINQLTMDEYTYRLTVLDKKYGAEEDYWEKMIKKTGEGEDELVKVITAHQIEIDRVKEDFAKAEKRRIEDEKNARKQALENTLADVGSILSTIGGLFQQSFDLKMDLIDQEEHRRIEAINDQYDAQIAALKGISEAEQAKTREVLNTIDREYNDKRQYILNNMEDNEERAKLLEELEITHEDALEKARIDREIAEQEAADAIIAIEDAKNEALRIASEDLEKKRRKARRQAAKQEKAVALLSAIVNTAAAVAKALPNIILSVAVGILGAAQIAIIAATPLPPLREGGIVMRPTTVLAGEAGPEAIIPLNKLGGAGGLMPAPIAFDMRVYFYGNINNAGDMDEISERLEAKVRRAVERGR